jgi:hypothetical protein
MIRSRSWRGAAFAAGTRLRRPLLRKHDTRGTDRVEGVGLAARAAFSPQPPDLEDGLATSREEAGQAGAEGAAALDREGTPTRRVLVGQLERTSITGRARGDRRLDHGSARADLDDRERVHVSVRINANDVINLTCKHLYRPPPETLAINNRSRSGSPPQFRPRSDHNRVRRFTPPL